jgi:hypothetical protein
MRESHSSPQRFGKPLHRAPQQLLEPLKFDRMASDLLLHNRSAHWKRVSEEIVSAGWNIAACAS